MPDATEPTRQQVEGLLWQVHDDCMAWLQESSERSVPIDRKIDQLMLGLASLAKALAGGYRDGGLRQ